MISLAVILAVWLAIYSLAFARSLHPNGLSIRGELAYLWHGVLVGIQCAFRTTPASPVGWRLRELTKEAHSVWHPEYLERVRERRW